MSRAGNESSSRNARILLQLGLWSVGNGTGEFFDSNTVFRLPDGSKLRPDAAWISLAKLARFTPDERENFLPLAPEFVIELRSKTDRLKDLHKKMHSWIANGVELAWLVDPYGRTTWIYTPGSEPRESPETEVIGGEGPVQGFELRTELIRALRQPGQS